MRRKFRELRENLEEFAYQDEFPVMVLKCGDGEVTYALKALEALDAENTSDLFIQFAEPFTDASTWVTRSLANLGALLEVLGRQRRAEGLAPFPRVPDFFEDPRVAPRERLTAAVHYLRGLLPDEDDHRLVVACLPIELRDPDAYAALMASLVSLDAPPPWMAAVRFVTRDPRERPILAAALRVHGVEHALCLDVDLGTAAVTDALTRDAADPGVPVSERMSALLQLAMLDFAYQRHDDAVAKFGVLHAHYAAHDAPVMQALCLQGVGDVMRARGASPEALARFQQALALAMRARSLPVILNLLTAAGETSMDVALHAEAQEYFTLAAQTAGAMLNPFARADAFERAGDAARVRRRAGDVIAAWSRCEEIAREVKYGPRLVSVLERRAAWHRELGMTEAEREALARLDAARALVASAHDHGAHA